MGSAGTIAAGIIVGLIASAVQSLGLTIQRKSHVLNEALPEGQQRLEYRRPCVYLSLVSKPILTGRVLQIDFGCWALVRIFVTCCTLCLMFISHLHLL